MTNRNKSIFITCALIFIIATGLIAIRRTKKGSNDFDTFYQTGLAVLQHQGIYYQGEFYKEQGNVSPFLYPPPAAIFFLPFGLLPLSIAAFLWNFLNCCFFALSLFLCQRLLNRNLSEFKKRNAFQLTLIFLMIASLFFDNLMMAQANILLLVLCLSGISLLQSQKKLLSGFVIALAILFKATPVFFLLYFLIKRQWRALTGVFIGLFVAGLLIPIFVFGKDGTRIFYRQWIGRTIKPGVAIALSHFQTTKTLHPQQKSPQQLQMIRLSDMLVEKNQSLEASLTRLLLKNRNDYATSTEFPIYVARRYMRLPILAGGIPLAPLTVLIRGITLALVLLMVILWSRIHQGNREIQLLEISLVFLGMILFSPFARSHQFISLLLPLLVIAGSDKNKFFLRIGIVLYFMQAIPYGKAAGFGTWSAVFILIIIFKELIQYSKKQASMQCFAPETRTCS